MLVLLTLPLVALFALAVAISLRATPFFQHGRPGRGGRMVNILKLRTLPTSVPRYADKHAIQLSEMPLPRICRVLRSTHLDELPQLLSVVTGRMSLVGPRPRLISDVEPVDETFDQLRTRVRPGCTGLWQISYRADGTATSAPILDLFYLDHACLRLDLWIIARTVGMIVGLGSRVELEDVPRWAYGSGLTRTGVDWEAVRVTARSPHTLVGPPPDWTSTLGGATVD